jgi:hypothetical protein
MKLRDRLKPQHYEQRLQEIRKEPKAETKQVERLSAILVKKRDPPQPRNSPAGLPNFSVSEIALPSRSVPEFRVNRFHDSLRPFEIIYSRTKIGSKPILKSSGDPGHLDINLDEVKIRLA